MSVKYELWHDENDLSDGYTFVGEGRAQGFKDRGLMSQDAKKIWEVEAETWILACIAYHEYMGWETYKPMLDPDLIQEYIDEYNNLTTPNPPPIHTYLGMTEEEYNNYLDNQ